MSTDLGDITPAPSGEVAKIGREFRHPIGAVWAAVTEPDQLAVWLMETSVLQLEVGGLIGFTEGEMGPPGTITALTPPTMIEFTWHTDPEASASVVRFELSETADGTRMVITHSRNPSPGQAAEHAAGWHTHQELLEAYLTGVPLPDFWPRFHELHSRYKAMKP